MPRNTSYPRGGFGRRQFLAGASALPALLGLNVSASEPKAAKLPAAPPGKLGIPGPYPGRVVEARNPAMIKDGVKDRDAIKRTVARGMKELTGADDAVEAWRAFFEPGDVVGIKMNPVGKPLAVSSAELMLEVIDGLKSAGVKTGDMFVFDRYKEELIAAGMHEAVPDGVRWGGLTPEDDPAQLRIDWPGGDPVSGYDPDEFMTMELVHRGSDPKDDRNLRSHLGLLVTRRVNKIVLLPVLKDHGSAGVTGALKNMSHGLVNNVARSHSAPDANACNQFIPQVVGHPIIRKRCVLQILDGIRGVYQQGPVRARARVRLGVQRPALRDRPGGARPRRVDHHRRQAQGEEPPGRRILRQVGPGPARRRGVRHPTAAAHRPGREPRARLLGLRVAPRPVALDRSPGRPGRMNRERRRRPPIGGTPSRAGRS